MGISKTEHFTEEQNDVAKLMKALAHPARIAIVEYLLSVDICICNDIVDEIKLAQPTVSQRIKKEWKNESKLFKKKRWKNIYFLKFALANKNLVESFFFENGKNGEFLFCHS